MDLYVRGLILCALLMQTKCALLHVNWLGNGQAMDGNLDLPPTTIDTFPRHFTTPGLINNQGLYCNPRTD